MRHRSLPTPIFDRIGAAPAGVKGAEFFVMDPPTGDRREGRGGDWQSPSVPPQGKGVVPVIAETPLLQLAIRYFKPHSFRAAHQIVAGGTRAGLPARLVNMVQPLHSLSLKKRRKKTVNDASSATIHIAARGSREGASR